MKGPTEAAYLRTGPFLEGLRVGQRPHGRKWGRVPGVGSGGSGSARCSEDSGSAWRWAGPAVAQGHVHS